MDGGLRTAENAKKHRTMTTIVQVPGGCRQAANFSDVTSRESVPETRFCRQAACFSDFLKMGSPGVSKGPPGHIQLQLYQQTPDPPPSAPPPSAAVTRPFYSFMNTKAKRSHHPTKRVRHSASRKKAFKKERATLQCTQIAKQERRLSRRKASNSG